MFIMEESDRSSNSCHTDSGQELRETNVDDSILRSGENPNSSLEAICALDSALESTLEPMLESALESARESALEPVLESALESTLESTLEPELESALESALESTLEPVLESALESVPESALESTLEPVYFRAQVQITLARKRPASQYDCSNPLELVFRLLMANLTRDLELPHKLFLYICLVTRLLMLFCLFIVAYGKTKARFKYTNEKASLLILWHCGDVERNPGPGPSTISDISRDFCKKMISLLIILYSERKEGRDLTQADYKKRPEGWAEDIWYGDPSKCTNKDRNAMLKGLCNLCLVQEVAIPNKWLELIDKYERSKDKQCSTTEKTKYAKDLKSWLRQRRTYEDAVHVFDRLNEDPEQDNDCIVGQIFERLKQHLPDLNSKIYQSRKIENEPVMSQDPGILGQCSQTYLSVNWNFPSEPNTIHADGRKKEIYNSISAQNKLVATQNQSSHSTEKTVADVHENGITNNSTLQADSVHDQGYSEDLLADNAISRVDYLTAYTEETNRNCSKACKRKNIPHDGLDITETVSLSKRQKGSSEMDFSQSTEIRLGCHYDPHSTGRVGGEVTNYTTTYTPRNKKESYDGTDTTLDDMMDIIQPEIQEDTIRSEDIPLPDLDIVIDDDILIDVEGLDKYLFE